MPAGERLVFEAMAFGGIDLGIAPERRDDRPQARHAVKEREYRPRRGQTVSFRLVRCMEGGVRLPARCPFPACGVRRAWRAARLSNSSAMGFATRASTRVFVSASCRRTASPRQRSEALLSERRNASVISALRCSGVMLLLLDPTEVQPGIAKTARV